VSDIRTQPLAPLDARIKITNGDRARVYALIGKQLDYLVNGPGSYYPDSGRKSPQTIGEDIKRFRERVKNLKSFVDEPASILDSVNNDLEQFEESFNKEVASRRIVSHFRQTSRLGVRIRTLSTPGDFSTGRRRTRFRSVFGFRTS
jgi:hypothetical protein